jgi:hypothetical protein
MTETRVPHGVTRMSVADFLLPVALTIAAVAAAGTAGADPTPQPAPPYVIETPAGPAVGGLQTLPPVCAAQPRACNLTWNPNTGAWTAPPGTGSP